MAYYMITYNSEVCVNPDLYCSFEGIKESEFWRRVAMRTIATRTVLANVVVPVTKVSAVTMLEKYLSITVQDIDRALLELEPAQGGTPLPAGLDVLALEGARKRFVKFNALDLENKYSRRDKMATIRVCGALYVALGHRRKGQDGIVLIAPKGV